MPANEDATHHNKDISATYFIGSTNCYDSTSNGGTDTTESPTNISPILWNINYVKELVYPNPFSNNINIEFTQSTNENISILIYNSTGQLIKRLLNNTLVPIGGYRITWDGKSDNGSSLPNGTYFYVIRSSSKKIKSGKILLLK